MARAFSMPGQMDLHVPVVDSEVEVSHMPDASCMPINGVRGHFDGGVANPVVTMSATTG